MRSSVLGHAMLAACLLALGNAALAEGEDLQRCLHNNGKPMDQRVCDSLRKHAEKRAREREAQAASDARMRAQAETWRAKDEETRHKQLAEQAQREARYQEELRQRTEAAQRQDEDNERQYRVAEQARASKETIRRQECGADYKRMSIGMTIERARRCVANFKLTGQINRADGVVSTYQSGRYFAHVMDGRIVSWGQ